MHGAQLLLIYYPLGASVGAAAALPAAEPWRQAVRPAVWRQPPRPAVWPQTGR